MWRKSWLRVICSILQQQQRRQKGFYEYDWDTLCRTGEIQHLLLHEIEKYLNHFKLSIQGKKADKVRRVMAHVCNRKGEQIDAFMLSQSEKNVSDNSCDIGSDASDDDDDNDKLRKRQ